MMYHCVVLFILLFLSAFFSGSETALFSLSSIRVKRLKLEQAPAADIIAALLTSPTALLITLLIGNTFANVFASSIATTLSIAAFGKSGIGISIAVMTVVVTIFCEIMPKIIAIRHAERFSRFSAPPLGYFSAIVAPVRVILQRISDALNAFFERWVHKSDPHITKDELESAIRVGYTRQGILDKEEAEMMEDVLQLSDRTVREVMVRRDNVVAFSVDMPLAYMYSAIKEAELSRIPVYRDSLDRICGILYAKDLLKKKHSNDRVVRLENLLREPFYTTADERLTVLLYEFRRRKIHMALVRDRNNRIAGIVTLEDLLEEIIGDIRDKETLVHRIRKRFAVAHT